MKTFILGLTLVFSIEAFGQIDSSSQIDSSRISQSITLSERQHLYLIGFMGAIRSADKIKYVTQVAASYDSADTAKLITIVAPSDLVVQMYHTMTVLQEGVAAQLNNEIKDALLPQITNPWLGAQLFAIMEDNRRQLNEANEYARKLVESLKQQ
jgi:hypothetical protein